jgi:hypothetical protein
LKASSCGIFGILPIFFSFKEKYYFERKMANIRISTYSRMHVYMNPLA